MMQPADSSAADCIRQNPAVGGMHGGNPFFERHENVFRMAQSFNRVGIAPRAGIDSA